MIKVFQIDTEMAIIKWEGLEDANLLVTAIQSLDDNITVKTINKELLK